jgi:hypothetical protein
VAQNTLWFYFNDEVQRRKLHGTPADSERKLNALRENDVRFDGLEMYLEPMRLQSGSAFTPEFIRQVRKMDRKSIHIGSGNAHFLYDSQIIADKFHILYRLAQQLEVRDIIIHAHHFKKERETIRRLMDNTLPGMNILIENNGFDNQWGAGPDTLTDIYNYFDDPRYRFCFDICHVGDWKEYTLGQFFRDPLLSERMAQIHYGYSTYYIDVAAEKRAQFDGEKPFHALWSYMDLEPSPGTMASISRYPVVIEGCVPEDDKTLQYLKEEIAILKKPVPTVNVDVREKVPSVKSEVFC